MSFDFAALKAQVRRTVHDTFAVPALYQEASGFQEELRVRFHTRIERFGDLEDRGWAEVIEGVNRLIFNKDELNEKGVLPARGATIALSAPGFESIVLVLQVKEPDAGPVGEAWQVTLQ